MRVLFAGTPDSAVPVLKYLLESEHEVVGVLTRRPARSGRGRRLTSCECRLAGFYPYYFKGCQSAS